MLETQISLLDGIDSGFRYRCTKSRGQKGVNEMRGLTTLVPFDHHSTTNAYDKLHHT